MWSIGQRIIIEFMENQEFIVIKHMEGGMGDVYKVVDPSLVNFFSIKTLKHRMNAANFKHECQIFVTASLHRTCVKPVGYGLIDSHPAIVYYWHTSSLADHNSKNWKPSEIEILLTELMDFFDHACSIINVLHCDIKPSNILLDHNKQPYVADFGISQMIETSELMHAPQAVAGTKEYMAPELPFTKRHNVKSELYSFGITIYEFLTGEHPYLNVNSPGKNSKKIAKNFKMLNKRLGKSMAGHLDYIESCMSIESAKRPDNFRSTVSPKSKKEQGERTLIDSIGMQASYYRKEKDYARSERILLDAITFYGRNPVLLGALGNTYALSKSREASIVLLEEASEIIFAKDCIWDSTLYFDPILNLSVQYRCVKRHHDAFVVLNRAWKIFREHKKPRFLYAEFGWMMIYEGDFLGACAYMKECFLTRSIEPFEMLCFAEAAWISGEIDRDADMILSKVIYNTQFDAPYFLCAFLLSKYASDQAVARLLTTVDEKSLRKIETCENKSQLSEYGFRPPKSKSIEATVILGMDHLVTGGRFHDLIYSKASENY